MNKNNWSTRLAFIITTSAYAVGLGNVWRFPYITGESGGGAFLLVYLTLILLIGIPILTMEIGLGRMSKSTTLLGFGRLSNKKQWNGLGWLGFATNMIIMCFYVMIMAWVVIYFIEFISGNIREIGIDDFPAHFDHVAENLPFVYLIIVLIMVLSAYIVSKGLNNGLERYSKIMMVGLAILILGLAIWASTLEGAAEGYEWYLYPDFSRITLKVVASAIGQLFFSIGVGMSIAFAFGSYTDNNENLITSTTWIVLTDTLFAILAGLMIFPALFTFGLSPDSGPNLIFITMASAFSQLTYGQWWGSIFFLLLFLAGFTSLIASIQGLKDSLEDKFILKPTKALLIVTTAITLGAIPVVLSYMESPIQLFEMTIFQLLDYSTNIILLPLSGLLIAIFGGYVIGYNKLSKHILHGTGLSRISGYWKVVIKVVIPLALLAVLINGFL